MSALWDGLQELLGGTLAFFYDLIPSFGLSIILLTILIGLVLFPLTLKQTRSMKAMQEIQPEVKRIQKELKHDREAQQRAMMEIYKEKGVNPAAGCLPLILQMPIWFALFSVLRSFGGSNPQKWVPDGSELETAVNLAGNGGHQLDFLWMDLTITPSDAFNIGFGKAVPYLLVIGLVMFTAYWQQRQTMARSQQGGAPQQQPGQAVMKIFPFFFGFISFSLPAGLVVYFAASQIFRIGQQALILSLDQRRHQEGEGGAAEAQPAKPPPPAPPEGENDAGRRSQSSTPDRPKRRPQGSKKKRGKKRRRR